MYIVKYLADLITYRHLEVFKFATKSFSDSHEDFFDFENVRSSIYLQTEIEIYRQPFVVYNCKVGSKSLTIRNLPMFALLKMNALRLKY